MPDIHVLLLGISHHTAAVDLRERVDFSTNGLLPALARLAERSRIGEAVVLSTCNRSEVYVTCSDQDAARDSVTGFLIDYHDVLPEMLADHLYVKSDADAARHLCRVTAGLDSLVVGEPQIFGQVKNAYTLAAEQHYTGPVLNKLFHTSFAAGKRVRAETGIAEGAVSVGYAAVALARKIFGKLEDLVVLLLGAGEMGKLTARHLHSQQVRRMVITSRTSAHAEMLASAIGVEWVPWSDRSGHLASSDIVIAATGSADPILSRAEVESALRARRNRPLFVIDIAVPRDVDPTAGDLEQVFLYNIDDLRTIVRDNLARRTSQVEEAERIVAEEVERFIAWLRSRDAIPTVVALRQRFEAIRRAELKRLEPKIAELSAEARARIDEITRLIIEKLLLTPTEQLKAVPDPHTVAAYSDALSRLFSLSAEDAAAQDPHTPQSGGPASPKTPVAP